MSAHPSFRELDRIALGERMPDASAHARECRACGEYLERLLVVEGPTAGMRQAAAPSRGRWLRPPPARWAVWAGAPALAALAATVWIVSPSPPASIEHSWVASKGAPSVAIFVKRGAKLALWDGATPLVPGDRLRIRVAPEGYTHVAIGAKDESSGSWSILYRGELDDGPEILLPGSWEVDTNPGKEHVVIALDRKPVELDGAPWRREVELPKAAP